MSATAPARRFAEELASFGGKKVSVETTDGRKYEGIVLGIQENLSIVLGSLEGEERAYKMVLGGHSVKEIRLVEKPFDLRALSDSIVRVFPGLVRLREDIGAIIVMDKVKVTESGVVEGTGPSADRVRQVYDEYIKTLKKPKEQQQA
ncbi:MAG: Lsm family RNA-binding protein [Nitrososphaerota archaeon]|nr:Lsm family RNA-binding protein [Nitrososphaerota archaeon]MDG6939909.1 Lsm family RNA-binding protein [Nitrososphaerota archaeon]